MGTWLRSVRTALSGGVSTEPSSLPWRSSWLLSERVVCPDVAGRLRHDRLWRHRGASCRFAQGGLGYCPGPTSLGGSCPRGMARGRRSLRGAAVRCWSRGDYFRFGGDRRRICGRDLLRARRYPLRVLDRLAGPGPQTMATVTSDSCTCTGSRDRHVGALSVRCRGVRCARSGSPCRRHGAAIPPLGALSGLRCRVRHRYRWSACLRLLAVPPSLSWVGSPRSEERRVGKECRARGARKTEYRR